MKNTTTKMVIKKMEKNGTSKKKNKKRYCKFINEQGNIE